MTSVFSALSISYALAALLIGATTLLAYYMISRFDELVGLSVLFVSLCIAVSFWGAVVARLEKTD